jgi:hypothetical protein
VVPRQPDLKALFRCRVRLGIPALPSDLRSMLPWASSPGELSRCGAHPGSVQDGTWSSCAASLLPRELDGDTGGCGLLAPAARLVGSSEEGSVCRTAICAARCMTTVVGPVTPIEQELVDESEPLSCPRTGFCNLRPAEAGRVLRCP